MNSNKIAFRYKIYANLLLLIAFTSIFKVIFDNTLINITQNLCSYVFFILAVSWNFSKIKKTIHLIPLSYIFVMLILGLDNWPQFFFADLGKYSLISIIFILTADEEFNQGFIRKILNGLSILLGVTLISCLFLFFLKGLNFRMSDEGRLSLFLGTISVAGILFYSVYLIPLCNSIKNKAFIYIGFVLYTFCVIYGASRTGIVLSLLALFFFALQQKKGGGIYILVFGGIISVSSFLLIIGTSSDSTILTSLELLIERFFVNDNFSNGRDMEQLLYLESINFNQFLMGKGLGGANQTWIWQDEPNGMPMLHIGYLYQLLKGGIIWCIIFYSLLIIALFKFNKLRSSFSKSLFYTLILLCLYDNLNRTIWVSPISLILFFLIISYSLNTKQKMITK